MYSVILYIIWSRTFALRAHCCLTLLQIDEGWMMPRNPKQTPTGASSCCYSDVHTSIVHTDGQTNHYHPQGKEVVLHQSDLPSVLTQDFVLFPNYDVVMVEKHSSTKDARRKKRESEKQPKKGQPAPEPKAVQQRNVVSPQLHQTTKRATSKDPGVAYAGTSNLKEPQTPTFQRLTTPEFSDDEELDFWSCCESSQSSMTETSDTPEIARGMRKWYVQLQS